MTTFSELTKRVHSISNLILSEMVADPKKDSEQVAEFRTHVMTTKKWFSRISWANKKRFLLALLEDVKSVWTISLLLKSIWNCRPKDAVLSVCQPRLWSSYDQVPMDHNRTALPLSVLKEVMTTDRKWFLTLEPEFQATLLSELLMISGGPILWEVLRCAQSIYDGYVEEGIQCLQECNVVSEPAAEKFKPPPEPTKKDQSASKKLPAGVPSVDTAKQPGQAQKELDASLAAWNSSIKSMRDRMKLEELEMVFSDGTRKKVWKVNRPKPEAVETVDFVQLLPSEIGKMILMKLPPTQLSDCARVNKYWSYLVDEIKLELTTRQKINIELEKLKDNMTRHDMSLELLARPEFQLSDILIPTKTDLPRKMTQTSTAMSYKSNVLSFKQVFKNTKKPSRAPQKPIRNMTDLNERLERRGAADENIWKWCKNVLRDGKSTNGKQNTKETEGIIPIEDSSFPCPLMKESLNVPLKSPLVKDPVESATVKTTVNISGADVHNPSMKQGNKRYSLWSKDMSGLYPVSKLPSYHFKL